MEYYVENLQELVENESLRVEEPPETIPLPDGPSLVDTLLEQERKNKLCDALAAVATAVPGDLAILEKMANIVHQKRQEFEGVEEAKEEDNTEHE